MTQLLSHVREGEHMAPSHMQHSSEGVGLNTESYLPGGVLVGKGLSFCSSAVTIAFSISGVRGS